MHVYIMFDVCWSITITYDIVKRLIRIGNLDLERDEKRVKSFVESKVLAFVQAYPKNEEWTKVVEEFLPM